jgi:Kef-type K+ transport system membrane component KefB
MFAAATVWKGAVYAVLMTFAKLATGVWLLPILRLGGAAAAAAAAAAEEATPPSRSLYPASILGLAMVARGEVAFLIASVAQSTGIFAGTSATEQLYLVVMWAAMVCTIVGPLGVGVLVRRVKVLEKGGVGVLGVWG